MPAHDENESHAQSFEIWLNRDKNMERTAKECNVSTATISRWASRYHWRERASAREREASRVADERAVRRRAALVERLTTAAETLVSRSLEYLESHELTDEKAAIAALREASNLVRGHDALPSWMREIADESDSTLLENYHAGRARIAANTADESNDGR